MIFFHKTTAFTHTMYLSRIRRNGFRRNGFWRNGSEPLGGRDEIIMKQVTIDVWWSASNTIINDHWQCLWLLVLASWTPPKQVVLLPVV